MAFYDKIPSEAPKFLVFWAWGLWALGIIAALCSFGASGYASNSYLKEIDDRMMRQQYDQSPPKAGGWSRVAVLTNWIAFLSFIAGLILFSTSIISGSNAAERTKKLNDQQAREDGTRSSGARPTNATAPAAAAAGK